MHEPSGWQVFGERTIYDNQWVQLGLADVVSPAGQRFEHHVVHLPRVAVSVGLGPARQPTEARIRELCTVS